MKFRALIRGNRVDIVPEKTVQNLYMPNAIWSLTGTFEETKARAINYLEDEKEKIQTCIDRIGDMTEEIYIPRKKE